VLSTDTTLLAQMSDQNDVNHSGDPAVAAGAAASLWIEFMGGRENEERAPEAKGIGQRRYTNREQMKIKRY